MQRILLGMMMGAAFLLLPSCTPAVLTYVPYQDVKGVDQTHYAQDLSECRQLAVEYKVPLDVTGGALSVGGAGAAAYPLGPMGMAGAAAGKTVGVVTSRADAFSIAAKQIVDRCMFYRGYHVIQPDH